MKELNSTDRESPEVQTRASAIWDGKDLLGFDAARIKHFKEATDNAVTMACLPGREISHGALVSLLESLLILSWSAFEGLAEDLHKNTRDKHSAIFNATLLSKDYRFRSERTLPQSYKDLFSDDVTINGAVWNADVKGHALLRHLLIHSNGVADDLFVKQRKIPPVVTEWDAYNRNNEITIDGELVRKIITRTTKAGFGLIAAVSQWLDTKI